MSLIKKVKTRELFECQTPYLVPLFEKSLYPWDMLLQIKDYAKKLVTEGIEGFSLLKPGVLIGRNVRVSPTATIEAPAVIGHNTEIRPGAYIRGNVITGEGCVLGNSSEFKNCILLDNVQAPHYNYIGDSILGNKSHVGAGVLCSNLKSDGKNVVVHGDENYDTGLRKLGAILADGADVGCGCVLNPGTVIGKNTRVYPLNSLRGVFAGGCIVKSQERVVELV